MEWIMFAIDDTHCRASLCLGEDRTLGTGKHPLVRLAL